MELYRKFTTPRQNVEDQVNWKLVDVKITGKNGAVIFEQKQVEVPADWSDNAAQILASKYFRKAGVPLGFLDGIPVAGMPAWLYPRQRDSGIETGGETSAKQVFHRLAGCWTYWGWREKLLTSDARAAIFYAELYMMLAMQMAAPNSPQWFNTGLNWAYGIEGPDNGQWTVDDDGEPYRIQNSYERPQPHACFIQTVEDDLVNPGGIMDLWMREVRLFKLGSGTGSNFSKVRGKGEPLGAGGVSSGLMSFLRIGDRAAGSIKSGGTTRRAAKMVVVDDDHPDIEEFIDWKVHEQEKAAAISIGSQVMRNMYLGAGGDDPLVAIPQAMKDRMTAGFEPQLYEVGWESEAEETVSGQNSNNSIRLRNAFFAAVDKDRAWKLTARTGSPVHDKWVRASYMWNKICGAAWACGDPGVQFHDTINEWHTCPNDGAINASNPCSEYMFLDDTACNLASLNLCRFFGADGSMDLRGFHHAVRLWTMVLEISVYMASFPSREIALGSYKYRTLGLGYANLGALLMRQGLPYDSDKGRALAAAITAYMTGVAYETSAEMADEIGPFPRWEANKREMHRVLRNHACACIAVVPKNVYDRVTQMPPEYQLEHVPTDLQRAIEGVWDGVLKVTEEGKRAGFRNAQTTLIAPTGTISFVMDCDTTGVEPDYALVKDKNLAGGGVMKIANQSVKPALLAMGYADETADKICSVLLNSGSLLLTRGDPAVFHCVNELRPMAHVDMVATVQPFLSGAVSKTTNLPNDAPISMVDEIYRAAWRKGLKSIALFRDGCKLSQPLSSSAPKRVEELGRHDRAVAEGFVERLRQEVRAELNGHARRNGNGIAEREMLPWRRDRGFTQKVKIDDNSVYLRVSEYPDGRPGELFLELAHEGSTLRSMANCLAISISLGLQHGVPLREYVDAFLFTRFEPAGPVQGHDRIKNCTSIADFIARELGLTYLGRDELAHVNPEHGDDINPTVERVVRLDVELTPVPIGFDISSHGPSTTAVRQTMTGAPCPQCGGLLIVNGTCHNCRNCGYNTGCG